MHKSAVVARFYARPSKGGGWQGVFIMEDGRRATRALRASSRRDADRAAAELAAAWGAARRGADVASYVASFVESLSASGAIEASTAKAYRASAAHIARAFAEVPLGDLAPQRVRDWEAAMARSYSASVVIKAHRLLKQALSRAAAEGEIPSNPLDQVRPPKNRRSKPGVNALDARGRARLMAALREMGPCRLSVAASVALYTGLRQAEICALRWADYSEGAATLWVRRSVGVGSAGVGAYEKATKTDRNRDVAVPPSLAALLAEWRPSAGGPYLLGGDRAASPSWLGLAWAALAERLGLAGSEGRPCTFHDLRHTWATVAVAAGIDIKTVAGNLGHADAAMTLNVYASADRDAKRRAAKVMDAALG